jgi:FlaA1/EpsC-like NDP-sugar epimerase
MMLDSFIVFSSVYVTYLVLYAPTVLNSPLLMFKSGNLLLTSLSLLVCHHIFAGFYKLYDKAWEHASVGEMLSIVKSSTLSMVVTTFIVYFVANDIYVRALGITWMVHLFLIGGSRFVWRILREKLVMNPNVNKRTMIIGAGSAGSILVRQLLQNHTMGFKPIIFIDDDQKKKKLQIHDITVVGDTRTIIENAKKYDIERIIIAIPSLGKREMARIYAECAKTRVKTVVMPSVEEVMVGNIENAQFKDVQVEDLLGREPIELDTKGISREIANKIVLVTGAGGSIGSEICRQVCNFKPKKLILLGHGENSIYLIDMELRNDKKNNFEIVPVIADVQDRKRIFEVIEKYQPDIIYHAAAHKHVPLMEYNPKESVKNNVIGTKNVAEAAGQFGVSAFVLVSTDKAVNPTNVMGSTKRIAEMIVQNQSKVSKTRFVAVRFGNVLGSRGSVIPLFKKQIKQGGPVTVTDPEMTRYFMTIPEASRLVLQAGALARGGEIFVLDMGEPVKIVDLAKNLITMSGYEIDEIGIQFTGLRPGEKMYEELLNEEEIHSAAVFPKIFIGKTIDFSFEDVDYLLKNFDIFTSEEVKEYVLDLANSRLKVKQKT